MPIYEYRCATCGVTEDVFTRSFADAVAERPCTADPSHSAQRTVANTPGMLLVGTGFYNTDFRDTKPNNPNTI